MTQKQSDEQVFSSEEAALKYVIDTWHGGSIPRAIIHVKSGLRMAEDRNDKKLALRIKGDLRILERMVEVPHVDLYCAYCHAPLFSRDSKHEKPPVCSKECYDLTYGSKK